MPTGDFHARPFDEATLTKLRIFELYTQGWLPVFLSPALPWPNELHIFDFFSGPGTDCTSVPGSPLRLIHQLQFFKELMGKKAVHIHVHFYDEDPDKIAQLKKILASNPLHLPNVSFDIQVIRFNDAFQNSANTLANPKSAKLVFIDQTGVAQVTPEVFDRLVISPTCDFLFFISSSTLHRFREDPAIKQKIIPLKDYYDVHRAVLEYYRSLIPTGKTYFLAPFSIKKNANIYGIIFGSAHPLGIDRFLQVAWKSDEISGEANFDINREGIRSDTPKLPFPEMRPRKLTVFENELEELLRQGRLNNEFEVIQVCFEHGVKRQHAEAILTKLKKENIIDLNFRIPDIKRLDSPRPICMIRQPPH